MSQNDGGENRDVRRQAFNKFCYKNRQNFNWNSQSVTNK